MEGKDRIAVVTGAARGIGGAIARALVPEVGHVVLADLDQSAGEVMASSIEAGVDEVAGARGSASFARCDVGSNEDVRALLTETAARYGGVDVLVNNAGLAEEPPFPDGDADSWITVVSVNLGGLMLATQLVTPLMRKRGGGVILNVSSVAALGLGVHPRPAYAATKAAVNKLTAALAPMAASDGIRVNAICPDFVAIESLAAKHAALTTEGRRAAGLPDRLVPLADVAEAALGLIRNRSLAGRVLDCPHDGPWRLLSDV